MENLKTAEISISAKKQSNKIVLRISDNGPGITGNSEQIFKNGVGLSNVVERLEKLYGSEQRFRLQNKNNGGLEIIVEIPFRTPFDQAS